MARIINYDRNHSFIVLATVITIVDHDLKTFIVQAIGVSGIKPSMLGLGIGVLTQFCTLPQCKSRIS